MKIKNPALRRFRDEQKIIAARITSQKVDFRKQQRDGNVEAKLSYSIRNDVRDYRHRHIAYCLVRGTAMESIEKPKIGHAPDMKVVNGILANLRSEVDREKALWEAQKAEQAVLQPQE